MFDLPGKYHWLIFPNEFLFLTGSLYAITPVTASTPTPTLTPVTRTQPKVA